MNGAVQQRHGLCLMLLCYDVCVPVLLPPRNIVMSFMYGMHDASMMSEAGARVCCVQAAPMRTPDADGVTTLLVKCPGRWKITK